MAKSKKTRKCKKNVKRIMLVTIFCLIINGFVITYIGSTFKEIIQLNKEKKDLTVLLGDLKEEEESLKVEVNKLQNPEYIAKYAREKFMYSNKNEYIIRIK